MIPTVHHRATLLFVALMLVLVGCTPRTAQSVGPLVTISAPRNGERVATGESIEFVSVASDTVTPIQRIELWIDGVLVGDSSTATDERLHQFTATQAWVFEEPHTANVEAFAYNIANERSQAATIQLQVEGPPPATEVPATEVAVTETPAASGTASPPPPTPEPTATATATPEPVTVEGRVNVIAGVNVRAGPGTNSTRVGGVFNNNPLVGIGRNEVGDWVKIRYDGGEGWVVARFVTWEGDIFLLPEVTE